MRKNKIRFVIMLALVVSIILIAIFAPVLAPFDPYEAVFENALNQPSSEHLFGTDNMGRDVFSRIIFGTRTSISYTLILISFIFLLGTSYGLIAGFIGGKLEMIMMSISTMAASFPGIVLALAFVGIFGTDIKNIIIAIAIVTFGRYARLSRSIVYKEKNRDYISVAVLSGTRRRFIIFRYLLPAVLPTLVITAVSDIGIIMLELAAFSFLGLSSSTDFIEWGYMLNQGKAYYETAPWLMLFPTLAIFLTVIIFNLFGDSLRDILDISTNSVTKKNRQFSLFPKTNSYKNSIAIGLTLGITLVLLLPITFYGMNSDNNSDPTHLNFGCFNYSSSVDPAKNINSALSGVRFGITETLFNVSDDLKIIPNLALNYEVSSDFKTWSIQIRDDILFSNGNKLSASLVKTSLERLFSQTDSSSGGRGSSTPQVYFKPTNIHADDNLNLVTIECAQPVYNLPSMLTHPYFAIIDTSTVQTKIIGTGPYKIDEIIHGVNIELSVNSFYKEKNLDFKTISIVFIQDSMTKSLALQSGDIDITENITTSSDIEKLDELDNFYVSQTPSIRTGNTYLNFNGILQNDILRQAIILAIDGQTICDTVVSGVHSYGFSPISSSLPFGYDELINPYEFNVEKSVSLLDENGIIDTDGDGIRELNGDNINLTYVTSTSRYLSEFAEAISISLKQIGIDVTLKFYDSDTTIALKDNGKFDMITNSVVTIDVDGPYAFLGNWYSDNSYKYGFYKNAEYDALYEQLSFTKTADERYEIITKLQQILINDAAVIVHGYYNSQLISNSEKVKNAELSPIDYYWITANLASVE